MAKITDDIRAGGGSGNNQRIELQNDGSGRVDVPDADFVDNAEILRDGQDLILRAEDGSEIVIEGYFSAAQPPMIFGPDGTALTPDLVNSFVQSYGPVQFAQQGTLTDVSPVGVVQEISGSSTVTRTDGTTETLSLGDPIYQGDIIETNGEGAVNIVFLDESSFAVSNNARLAIDEYVYDPSTDAGTTNFSMLRGMFVYTSGLIGREDPDDVEIQTPMGSIGIRGTVIAGDVDAGEFTVVEGAIVLRSFSGQTQTLAAQYETAKFMPDTGDIILLGQQDGADLGAKFSGMSGVAPNFVGGLGNDQNNTQNGENTSGETEDSGDDEVQTQEDAPQDEAGTDDTGAADSDAGTETNTEDEGVEAVDGEESSDAGATEDTGTTGEDGTTQDEGLVPVTDSGETDFSGTQDTFSPEGDTTGTGGTTSGTSGTGGSGGTTSTTSNSSDTTTDTTTPLPPPSVIEGAPTGTGGNIGVLFAPSLEQNLFSDGSSGTFTVGGRFTDPNADPLTFSITNVAQDGTAIATPGWLTVTNASNGTIQFTLPDTLLAAGAADSTFAIRVTATDTGGNTGSAVFFMDILAPDTGLGGSAGADPGLNAAAGQVATGLAGADTLTASGVGAILFGGLGNDTFNLDADNSKAYGEDGDDIINVGVGGGPVGNAEVFGGLGNDIVNVGVNASGSSNFYGGSGSDTIDYSASIFAGITVTLQATGSIVTGAGDFIRGFENVIGTGGDDTIQGDAGVNSLSGGAGDDIIRGDAGDDTIDGGTNTGVGDTLDYLVAGASGGVNVSLAAGTATGGFGNDTISNIENVNGTNFNDTIEGNTANNTLQGAGGDDTFIISGGNDIIDGGIGFNDTYDASSVTTGSGVLYQINVTNVVASITTTMPFFSADTITGVESFVDGTVNGTFTINAFNRDMSFDGGGGTDSYSNASGVDLTINLSGATSATITETSGPTNTHGITNIEVINGGAASDETFMVLNAAAAQTIDGGAGGTDILDFSNLGGGFSFDISAGTAGSLNFSNISDFIASTGADTFIAVDDAIGRSYDGYSGNDTYDGSTNIVTPSTFDMITGQVQIGGGATDSVLNIENFIGGSNDDTFIADDGDGNKTFDGNGGTADHYDGSALTAGTFTFNSTNVIVTDTDTDTVTNVEEFTGGSGIGDTLDFSGATGSVDVDLALGTGQIIDDGFSNTYSAFQFENIVGSAQADTLAGDALANLIQGGTGSDIISGNDGDDTLEGEAGDDWISGGDGLDTLTGGAGNDVFVFENITAFNDIDVITDFTPANDKIDLGSILILNGYDPFTDDITDWVQILDNGGDSDVYVDVTGTGTFGAPQHIATLQGITGLQGTEATMEANGDLITQIIVAGTAGPDNIVGTAADETFIGSAGNDALDGAGGFNTLDYSSAGGNITVDIGFGGAQAIGGGFGTDTLANFQAIKGGGFDDTLTGNTQNNIIQGGAGNDTIDGGTGSDTLEGGTGDDTYLAFGSDGNDTINDAGGTNDIYDATAITAGAVMVNLNGTTSSVQDTAGGFTDTIIGGNIEGYVLGATGGTFTVNAFNGDKTLDGGSASNYIINTSTVLIDLDGASSATVTDGTDTHTLINIDTINGSSGFNETFSVNDINANHAIFGGAGGTDVLDFTNIAQNVNFNMSPGNIDINTGGTINFNDIEEFYGSNTQDDTVYAFDSDGNMYFDGGGETTADHYDASGLGVTTFDFTGAGNQVIATSTDTDTVVNFEQFTGGPGASWLYFTGSPGIDIDLSSNIINDDGRGNTYDIFNVNNLDGSGAADTITGNTLSNSINAGAGDDTIYATDGSDFIDGEGGIDILDFSVNAVNAIDINLSATSVADDGWGNAGGSISNIEHVIGTDFTSNDSLTGDNITINEASVYQHIQGGQGADTFRYQSVVDINSDGVTTILEGGNSFGDNDILEFADGGGGTYNIDPNAGDGDVITEIEVYDFQSNFATDTINLWLQDDMIDFNQLMAGERTLTIQVNNFDNLDLRFGLLSSNYSVVAGNIDTSNDGFIEFHENGGLGGVVRVEYMFGGGGTINIMGLGPDTGLNLNKIAAGLNTTDGFYITDDAGQGFGAKFAAMGDTFGGTGVLLNVQDGYDDLLMISEMGNLVVGLEGGLALSNTDVPGLNTTSAAFVLAPDDFSISSVGDFNGDGVRDFILGTPNDDDLGGASGSGNAYVLDIDGNIIVELDGLTAGEQAGDSVAGIGDFDGDGYSDVVIGAPNAGASGEGAAYLLFGANTADLPAGFNVNSLSSFLSNDTDVANDPVNIAIDGDYAYVVSPGGNIVEIFDISDPSAVVLTNSINSAIIGGTELDGAKAIAIEGKLAFIAAGASNSLTILDISGTPSMPTHVATLQDGTNLVNVQDVAVYGDYVFMISPTAGTTGGMTVIDISDPSAPVFDNFFGDANITSSGDITGANAIALSDDGQYAYIGSTGTNQLVVVDISTPSAPSYQTTLTDPAFSNVTDIVVVNDLMFVTGYNNDALTVLDISSPDTPVVLDSFSNIVLDGANGVAVHGNFAYVTSSLGDSVAIIDISDPANLVLIDSYADGVNLDNATGIAVDHQGNVFALGRNGAAINSLEYDIDGIRIDGLSAGDATGLDVLGVGDVNDDGLSDFIITVPTVSGGAGVGEVHLVLGGQDRMTDITLGVDTFAITGIDVDSGDPEIPVFYLGDVDGGGQSDFAVFSDDGGGNQALHIFQGETARNAGGTATAGSAEIIFSAAAGHDILSGGAIGDFNADGYDDFVVVIDDTGDGQDIAEIWVVLGGSTMVALDGLDTSALVDGTNAFLMTYNFGADDDPANFAFEISQAGDLNGDGFADIAIGLPNVDNDPNTNSDALGGMDDDNDGTTVIVYGQDVLGGVDTHIIGTSGPDSPLNATASGDSVVGGAGSDVLLQDNVAYTNLKMFGGAGDDTIAFLDNSFSLIDGGAGNDRIGFEGTRLDLRNFTYEQIQRIEEIGIDGNAAQQTLIVSDTNLMNLMTSSDGLDLHISDTEGTYNDILLIEINGPESRSFTLAEVTYFADMIGGTHFDSGTVEDFNIGGYQLSIDESYFTSGNIIMGRNFVQDGDAADNDAGINTIEATGTEQSLIGSSGNDILMDGSQTDTGMFGLEGNDIFEINNGNFGVIDGGEGITDAIHYMLDDTTLDLRSFDAQEIRRIEAIQLNDADGGQTLVLTLENIMDLAMSSDSGNLDLQTVSNANNLVINDLDGSVEAGNNFNNAASLAAELDMADDGTANSSIYEGGGFIYFNGGANSFFIDANFFTSSNVEVI